MWSLSASETFVLHWNLHFKQSFSVTFLDFTILPTAHIPVLKVSIVFLYFSSMFQVWLFFCVLGLSSLVYQGLQVHNYWHLEIFASISPSLTDDSLCVGVTAS